MPGARDRRVSVGSGGRPAYQGKRRGGGGDVPIGTSASGGGSKSWGLSPQGNKGCLRYSPGEESAVKREMEKELRLRRLQQVREQSRKQAAAMRQEYRQRRDENKRAVLRESRHQFEANRAAEVMAMNERLQAKLLEVGTAHRMAACTNLVREREEDRRRRERSKSAERRRARNLAAIEKRAAELRDSRKGIEAAEHRQEVWREEGEEERARAREEMARQEASAAARRARAEVEAQQLRQRAGESGVVKSTEAKIVQSGPRLEDFKKSRVHAAVVLRHGTTTGARVMGVETAAGDPTEESIRQQALARDRKETEEQAHCRAEKRGHDAFMVGRDRQVAERVEEELRRLHELDRRRRHSIGAAETNLAALREREVHRAKFARARPDASWVAGMDSSQRPGKRRPEDGHVDMGGRGPPSAPQIDGSGRRNWPAWWPIPPPHPISHVSNRGGAMPDVASRPGIPLQAARPSTQLMAQELERLRLLQNTRQKLFRAAHRAGDQGRGRAATLGEVAISSKGKDSPPSPCLPPSVIAPTWPISTSAAAAVAAAETSFVGDDNTSTAVGARPVSISAPDLHLRTGGTTTTLRVPSSSGLMPEGVASGALPREPPTASSDVSSLLPSPPAEHPSYSSQRHSRDAWGMSAATTAYSGRARREASEEKVASGGIPAAGAPPTLARPPTARTRKGGRTQQYSDESLLSEGGEKVEVSGDVSDGDSTVAVSEARRGMRTDGEVRNPLVRQVDFAWEADSKASRAGEGQRNAAKTDEEPSSASSHERPRSPVLSSAAAAVSEQTSAPRHRFTSPTAYYDIAASPGAQRETPPSPSSVGSAPATGPTTKPHRASGVSVAVQTMDVEASPPSVLSEMTTVLPRVSVAVNTSASSNIVERLGSGTMGGATAGLRERPTRETSCDTAVQVGSPPSPFREARSSPVICDPTASDPGSSALFDGESDESPSRSADDRSDAVDARPQTPRSPSTPPSHLSALDAATASSLASTLSEHSPLAPMGASGDLRETARVGAWTGDSAVAEVGFTHTEGTMPPLQSSPPPATSAFREETANHVRESTTPLPSYRYRGGTALGEFGNVGRYSGDGGSVTTSSTSTLPPLDRELAELLERHRRLDKEALNLTRRAAEDALRWGGEVSSGAGDTSSSSVVRDRATPSSRSSFSSSRNRSGVRTDDAEDKISPSRNDFSLSEGGDGLSMTLGMHTFRRSETGSRLPGNVVGDDISADGGADPVAISWDHETVEPMARPGPSAPGLAGRWRLGSAGSQAALGLWAQGAEGGKSETYDADLSPRGDVDTAPEVTEWARRIQASIESMNRLVDGFQLAGMGPGGPVLATRTVSSPASDSPPGSDPGTATSIASGGGAGAESDLSGLDENRLTSRGANGASSAAPGVESLASAQLGFRRGLQGLLAGMASGGGSGGGSEGGISPALSGWPSTTAALDEGNTEERDQGTSPRIKRAGWEEPYALGTPWTGNQELDEERSRASSSSVGGGQAISAVGSGGSGIGSGGKDGGGGGGGKEGSLLSSSSASFGPDLNAEIASLEALAESLQQRKIRFEPKPALLIQQQRELEDCRRAIRSTTASSVSTESSAPSEAAELSQTRHSILFDSRAEESESESGAEDALAALDALRAELDAQEYDASRIEDSFGQNELFAPHASCEATALPGVAGDHSSIMSSEVIGESTGEEGSHAQRRSPQSSSDEVQTEVKKEDDRMPDSEASSSEYYHAFMRELLSVDTTAIQRARAVIASPVLRNPVGGEASLTRVGRGKGRGTEKDTFGTGAAEPKWYRDGVEEWKGSTRGGIGFRPGDREKERPSEHVLAPDRSVEDKGEGGLGEQGEQRADPVSGARRCGESAAMKLPESPERPTDEELDSEEASFEEKDTPLPSSLGPVSRASTATAPGNAILPLAMASPTTQGKAYSGGDEDHRRGSSLSASVSERNVGEYRRPLRESVDDIRARTWGDFEEIGRDDAATAPSSPESAAFHHHDIGSDSGSLGFSSRDWSGEGAGGEGVTPRNDGIKIGHEVEHPDGSTTPLGLDDDASLGDRNVGKTNRTGDINERSRRLAEGVTKLTPVGVVERDRESPREDRSEASPRKNGEEPSAVELTMKRDESESSTARGLSIDPELLMEPSRSDGDALTPLEAPGWGSLTEFIENISADSGGSGTAWRDGEGGQRRALEEDFSSELFRPGEYSGESGRWDGIDAEEGRIDGGVSGHERNAGGNEAEVALDDDCHASRIDGVEEEKETSPSTAASADTVAVTATGAKATSPIAEGDGRFFKHNWSSPASRSGADSSLERAVVIDRVGSEEVPDIPGGRSVAEDFTTLDEGSLSSNVRERPQRPRHDRARAMQDGDRSLAETARDPILGDSFGAAYTRTSVSFGGSDRDSASSIDGDRTVESRYTEGHRRWPQRERYALGVKHDSAEGNSKEEEHIDSDCGSAASDIADVSGGGGAALGLVGSDSEDLTSAKDMCDESADSFERPLHAVSMIHAEEGKGRGWDSGRPNSGVNSSRDGTGDGDNEAVSRRTLEDIGVEREVAEAGERVASLRDAIEHRFHERIRPGSLQGASFPSKEGSFEDQSLRSSAGFRTDTSSRRRDEGGRRSPRSPYEEKDDSWCSREGREQAHGGGDGDRGDSGDDGHGGGADTTITEDSLKASEWSLDSLSLRRERSKGAAGTEPSPKSGVAVAWELGRAVSAGTGRAAGGCAPHDLERGDRRGTERDSRDEEKHDLATAFRRRAPAFIERSKAREAELRKRREERQEARDKAAVEAATEAATATEAVDPAIPSHATRESRAVAVNQERVREQKGTGARRRSDSAGFQESLGKATEGGGGGRRRVSTKEARERTARLYNALPEVVKERKEKERKEERARRLVETRESEKQRSRFRRGARRGSGET